jgi:hypothetical protein
MNNSHREVLRWTALVGSSTLALGLAVLGAPASAAAPADDAYLRGYATAVLEQTFGIRTPAISVDNGVIRVPASAIGTTDRGQVLAALRRIPGVTGAEIVEALPPSTVTAATAAPTAAAGRSPHSDAEDDAERAKNNGPFPPGYLFDALLADPRWPHFSAEYQHYLHNNRFGDVAAVSFGETIPFYRWALPFGGRVELGLQGSVFAIFDMDSDSRDLVNADYFVAAAGAYAVGPFQTLVRIFHQSSHLGDEFLIHDRPERVNLSYEAVDLKLSYHFLNRALRVYAGGGYLFDQDPKSIDPWIVSGGVEVRSPWSFGPGITPVAAMNVQVRQEAHWNPELSVRAGVQFDNAKVLGRRLLVMLEYFHGNSPNGQFFRKEIEYFGIGAHFYYGGGGE